MIEPISITSLILTVLAITGYGGKKALKKGKIKSNCGVELTDVIQNTKVEIIDELKKVIDEKLNVLVGQKIEEHINVERSRKMSV